MIVGKATDVTGATLFEEPLHEAIIKNRDTEGLIVRGVSTRRCRLFSPFVLAILTNNETAYFQMVEVDTGLGGIHLGRGEEVFISVFINEIHNILEERGR